METARAFNPFLIAKSDKLKKLIEEVQQQIEGYEAHYQTRQRARRTADQQTHELMIEEKFGTGIMSAIDFDMSVTKVPSEKGDRVKVEMSGKFLAYYSW